MNYEALNNDLRSKLEKVIQKVGSGKGDTIDFQFFKSELKKSIFEIIDANNLTFTNAESSANFLYNLKPTIDDMVNKFLQGK